MNKISRRNFLKVAGAGAAAMGLAACGGSSSSSSSVAASSTAANAAGDTLSGTIEYWSSWSETENQALVLKQAADAFTQLHPNVKINFTFNGRDNRNLVVSAIEAGTQIDLMDANIYLRIFFSAETSGCKVSSWVCSSALLDCSAENSASNAEKSTAVLPVSFIRIRTALLNASSSSLCWAA